MVDLSENISRHEMSCKCGCGFNAADIELIQIVQGVVNFCEEFYNQDCLLIITSGNRCRYYNEVIKYNNDNNYIFGSSKSFHMLAMAMDFQIVTKKDLAQIETSFINDFLMKKYPGKYGFGIYDDFNHLDVRAKMARWDKRTIK
jgi:uncharacterized protein YcbK (DUF882 family)